MTFSLIHADCLDAMKAMADDSVDVTITSPPYTDQRTYGIAFKLSGQDWVDWCAERIVEMCRVTAGIVFFNAAGPVRDFQYQPVVEWLVADLTRKHGIVCGPAPYVFHRVGIPGSGGPHYHRRDWEPVYCFAKPASLPPKWSDNTATGHPPKWAPGGEMSHRLSDGTRTNQWGKTGSMTGTTATGNKEKPTIGAPRPSHVMRTNKRLCPKGGNQRRPDGSREQFTKPGGTATSGKRDGDTQTQDGIYDPPAIANSGNKIMETYTAAEYVAMIKEKYTASEVTKMLGDPSDVRELKVGGGSMGSKIAHESEAPFSEALVRFFIVSFCKPGGTVLDPFCGSGTSVSVAVQENRNAIGIDIRNGKGGLASARRRLLGITSAALFAGEE